MFSFNTRNAVRAHLSLAHHRISRHFNLLLMSLYTLFFAFLPFGDLIISVVNSASLLPRFVFTRDLAIRIRFRVSWEFKGSVYGSVYC